MKVYLDKEKCYGCGRCQKVCQSEAITMQYDDEGFLYPVIDAEKCIHCGLCMKSCIENQIFQLEAFERKTLAAVSHNKQLRKQSSSGGFFTEAAKYVIENDGVVYGAGYDDELNVKHKRIVHIEDLCQLQGTKYIQSDLTGVLDELMEDARSGRSILFSGTPCQIAAAKALLGDYEKIVLVELICMGVPSPLVWKKYLSEIENDYGTVHQVSFRDKVSGWKTSSITYTTEGGQYSFRHHMDLFTAGFGQALFLRKSCHSCKFKGEQAVGDIQIGDFWGIENYSKNYKGADGVSLVMIKSSQGETFWNKVQKLFDQEEIPYQFAVSHNHCIMLNKRVSKFREDFFREWIEHHYVETGKIIRKYLYPQFDQKERYWVQYPVVEALLRKHIYGRGIDDFFMENHYQKVAVYGLGELGKLLVEDLLKTDIEITCIMDRNYVRFPEYYKGIKVIGPHQIEGMEYDCIIVTIIHLFNDILEVLMTQKVDVDKVISMGSIV